MTTAREVYMADPHDCEFIRIYDEDGIRYIKVTDFVYQVEGDSETPWRHIQYGFYEMPLDEAMAMGYFEMMEELEQNPQWIDDLTEEEVYELDLVDDDTILIESIDDITADLECGEYMIKQ